MKKITVAGILLVMLSVFIFNGEACAFFFKKGMSSKEIEEKATEILKGSIPASMNLNLSHALACAARTKFRIRLLHGSRNLMHDSSGHILL